jgi:hypothetical protein
MWWAPTAALVRLLAQRVALGDPEVLEELELDVLEPGVVEHLLHLVQRRGLELVLDVGVPEAYSLEADLGGFGTAVLPAEGAPLAADVHLNGPGDRPVESQQIRFAHRASSSDRGPCGDGTSGACGSPASQRIPSCL